VREKRRGRHAGSRLVPNRAEQVSAGWRTDHQANHGFFDSIRSHVPVSGLSGIHLGQIIGGPHGVAGVIEAWLESNGSTSNEAFHTPKVTW